jgi:hypothetical protein
MSPNRQWVVSWELLKLFLNVFTVVINVFYKCKLILLGRTDAEEYADKLHLVSKILHNQCGLLFTNETQVKIQLYLQV